MKARRAGVVGAAVIVVALALSSCTSPRNALGTNTSVCFRALAAGRTAVGSKGVFAGVRYVTPAALSEALGHSRPRTKSPLGRAHRAVCAIAYRGQFSASAVLRPWPAGRIEAPYAVVVVTGDSDPVRGDDVVATILLQRVDIRLTRP